MEEVGQEGGRRGAGDRVTAPEPAGGAGRAEGICQQAPLLSAAGQRGETALKLTLGGRGSQPSCGRPGEHIVKPGLHSETRSN